jgi:DnaJ-domain-containing protein 1
MRALIIGLLIVVVVHSAMTMATRVSTEKLGRFSQLIAKFGIVLGIFVPRLRTIAWYLALMWPFLSSKARSGAANSPGAAGRMSVQEAREVLGVVPNASREEITMAWRSLLKKHHPDQGGSADYTRRLNEARKVLLEAIRR